MAPIRFFACLIILITLALSAGAADTNGTDPGPYDTRRAYQTNAASFRRRGGRRRNPCENGQVNCR